METNNIILNVVKQLLVYNIDSTIINEDNTVTHVHSDEFLDNHPDRRKTPEYTEKEELELIKYINDINKII
jgi:hypothetical protein